MPDFDRNPVNLCAEALVFPLYSTEGLGKAAEGGYVAIFFCKIIRSELLWCVKRPAIIITM